LKLRCDKGWREGQLRGEGFYRLARGHDAAVIILHARELGYKVFGLLVLLKLLEEFLDRSQDLLQFVRPGIENGDHKVNEAYDPAYRACDVCNRAYYIAQLVSPLYALDTPLLQSVPQIALDIWFICCICHS
jgi:hypothetical protein